MKNLGRLNSLEVNWIRNVDKSMPIPEVVFAPAEDCGGYFLRPAKKEIILEDGLYHPQDRGIIVVSTLVSSDHADSVIAHEWRHIWQYYQGWKYDGIEWNNPEDYEDAIIRYFTESVSEADALKFDIAHTNSDYHDQWLSLLTYANEWY